MNKSTIEWTDYTSNPLRGKCLHACAYCYAERIRLRFKQPAELSWHPEELAAIEKKKKPCTIFMGSMHDLFGEWVPQSYIDWTIDTAKNCPQHTFLFLTKNPKRYDQFIFPNNCWLGYTEDGVNNVRGWMYASKQQNMFISFEPLIGNNLNVNFAFIKGVIIGAQTGPTGTGLPPIKPQRLVLDKIIEKAGDRPIFLKDNLLSLFPDLPRRRELPWKLNK